MEHGSASVKDVQSLFIAVCPECSARMKVGVNKLGEHITCPQCHHRFVAGEESLTDNPRSGERPAVPAKQEVPSLIYQLEQASNQKQVEFASIATSGGASSGSSASSSASTAAAGFTQMPFTFTFNGSFFDLYHLFQQLNGFTLRTASGGLQISGRLLTIQSVKLAPASEKTSKGQLAGTITATAYVLPASQGLTGGATPASPAATTQTKRRPRFWAWAEADRVLCILR